jgi:hypothetical protein
MSGYPTYQDLGNYFKVNCCMTGLWGWAFSESVSLRTGCGRPLA